MLDPYTPCNACDTLFVMLSDESSPYIASDFSFLEEDLKTLKNTVECISLSSRFGILLAPSGFVTDDPSTQMFHNGWDYVKENYDVLGTEYRYAATFPPSGERYHEDDIYNFVTDLIEMNKPNRVVYVLDDSGSINASEILVTLKKVFPRITGVKQTFTYGAESYFLHFANALEKLAKGNWLKKYVF